MTNNKTIDNTLVSNSGYQHFHRENDLATVETEIKSGIDKKNILYCKFDEKKDKVYIYIKAKFNTNGLDAKSKACIFYEKIKKEFLGEKK